MVAQVTHVFLVQIAGDIPLYYKGVGSHFRDPFFEKFGWVYSWFDCVHSRCCVECIETYLNNEKCRLAFMQDSIFWFVPFRNSLSNPSSCVQMQLGYYDFDINSRFIRQRSNTSIMSSSHISAACQSVSVAFGVQISHFCSMTTSATLNVPSALTSPTILFFCQWA